MEIKYECFCPCLPNPPLKNGSRDEQTTCCSKFHINTLLKLNDNIVNKVFRLLIWINGDVAELKKGRSFDFFLIFICNLF